MAAEDAETTRLRFTWTQTMDVDVEPDEAVALLDPVDYLDVIDAATRYRRYAAHDYEYIEHDVSVASSDDGYLTWGYKPLDGVKGRERYLQSACHFVTLARQELSSGRYREGNCPELDAVNRDLAAIEGRLSTMALAAEPSVLIDGTPEP